MYTPFSKYRDTRHTTRVNAPTSRWYHEPKVSAPLPPPQEFIPTGRSESPMAMTTQADTTGVR